MRERNHRDNPSVLNWRNRLFCRLRLPSSVWGRILPLPEQKSPVGINGRQSSGQDAIVDTYISVFNSGIEAAFCRILSESGVGIFQGNETASLLSSILFATCRTSCKIWMRFCNGISSILPILNSRLLMRRLPCFSSVEFLAITLIKYGTIRIVSHETRDSKAAFF